MGKRKHRPLLHQQEQCDVWLSTAEKKEQTPAAKKQRLFRPITNISNLILSSQPIKAGTKQTDIKNFFAPKSATVKENAVPQAYLSSSSRNLPSPRYISLPSNTARKSRPLTELPGHRTVENTASLKSHQRDEAKFTSAISITHSANSSFNVSKSSSIPAVFKIDKDKTTLLHGARETDFSSFSQDANSNELFQISQDLPRIPSDSELSEDTGITFTMGTQGCLKVKKSKTERVDLDTFDTQESLKAIAGDSESFAERGDIPALQYSQITIHACHDSSENEASEEGITFTMGTQGCLKVKPKSKTKRQIDHDVHNTQENLKAYALCCDLFASPDSQHSQSILDIPQCATACEHVQHGSSENEVSEDVTFTMGTQGCLKAKPSKTNRQIDHDTINAQECSDTIADDSELSTKRGCILDSSSSQSIHDIPNVHKIFAARKNESSDIEASEDITFTMGTQGCFKVKQSKTKRHVDVDAVETQDNLESSAVNTKLSATTDDSPSLLSEDLTQDVTFTMGSQGFLEDGGQKSNIEQSLPSEDSSQDVAFTMGSQGCLKIRDSKGQRSNVTPSLPSGDSSQDVAFAMGSQGCLKIRDPKGQRSNITPSLPSEDSSQDVAFTMGSQSCLKVIDLKGLKSNITPSLPSEDLSQDVTFTMGSQDCLNIRDLEGLKSNITPSLPSEDLSQDVAFTMGSQDCLNIRDLEGHRSNITPSLPSEDLSQDVAFTMDSQDCLNIRDLEGHRSNITPSLPSEDLSQDVVFTMDSQGCLKVRDLKS